MVHENYQRGPRHMRYFVRCQMHYDGQQFGERHGFRVEEVVQ
jgi:hypothetical protein